MRLFLLLAFLLAFAAPAAAADATDRVSVMRASRIVATLDTAATNAESLAELMIGQRLPPGDTHPP